MWCEQPFLNSNSNPVIFFQRPATPPGSPCLGAPRRGGCSDRAWRHSRSRQVQGAAACVNDMGYYRVLPCHKDRKGPENGPALREQGARVVGRGRCAGRSRAWIERGPADPAPLEASEAGDDCSLTRFEGAGRRPNGGPRLGDAEGYRGRAAARSRRGRSQHSGPGPVPGARWQQDSPMFRGGTL